MRIDGSDLEKVCEYADMCSQSNYGNREQCEDKFNCKLYYKMERTERLMWEYTQPINDEEEEDELDEETDP